MPQKNCISRADWAHLARGRKLTVNIWSANHPEIAFPFNQHDDTFWGGAVPRWRQVRRHTHSCPYRQDGLVGMSGAIFSPSGVFPPWFISPTRTHRCIFGASRFTGSQLVCVMCLPVSLVLCFVSM